MHKHCKLMIISVVLLVACSDQSGELGQVVECEGSLAPCTFQEIISAILRRQPTTPLETPPFTIDFIKKRYGTEEINCSHPLLSDNSEFRRIAGLSPGPDINLWFSHEELEKYDHLETAWECDNGESFTEYEKGILRSEPGSSIVIDSAPIYGIVRGTATDPEILEQLETLWGNCKVGTEPPNFTGVFMTGAGFLEEYKFCITLDILPGAKQCFTRANSPESIEYSSHSGEIDSMEQPVSENDYCQSTDSSERRIKIF